MKINEIVNEGIWDTIKAGAAGVKGAVQGGIAGATSAYQTAQEKTAQQQGAADVNQYAKEVIRAWNEYTGGTGQTDVKAWASRFFDANLADFPITTADLNDPNKVRDFLISVVKQYKAGLLKPLSGRRGRRAEYGTKASPAPAPAPTPTTAPKTKAAPIDTDDVMYMGGQRLDPRNPDEKAIIDKVKSQTAPQQPSTQDPSTAPVTKPKVPNTSKLSPVSKSKPVAKVKVPDVSNLSSEERAELRKLLQGS